MFRNRQAIEPERLLHEKIMFWIKRNMSVVTPVSLKTHNNPARRTSAASRAVGSGPRYVL